MAHIAPPLRQRLSAGDLVATGTISATGERWLRDGAMVTLLVAPAR